MRDIAVPQRVKLPMPIYEQASKQLLPLMLRAGASTLGREVLVYNPGEVLARTALQYMLSGIVANQRSTYPNLAVIDSVLPHSIGMLPIIGFCGVDSFTEVTKLASTAMEEANELLPVFKQVLIPEVHMS
ncbi:MAG: hypothetical protein JWL89_456 [Candidatus Saccharibacteria bacterium]|nr:hypothetical protein [Candidatus Saccharibacteria bacterium]